jgi:hypothetical protein
MEELTVEPLRRARSPRGHLLRVVATIIALSIVVPATAHAEEQPEPGEPLAEQPVIRELSDAPRPRSTSTTVSTPPIRFPVDGPSTWSDTFGACRDGCARPHEGQDIMADKLQPIVAARAGRVTWMQYSTSGNYVFIQAADGWTYGYIHLNNDSPGTDDGANPRRWAFGPGIERGKWVRKGALVGFVGDSGNAEHTAPHLHFEIRHPNGYAINGAEALRNAARWGNGPRWSIYTGFAGQGPDRWFPSRAGAGDQPLACDINGDGRDQPVLFRPPRGGRWAFRTTATVQGSLRAGPLFGKLSGDVAVCGDWNGNGTDTIGIFRKGDWLLSDRNKDPRVRHQFRFGVVTGDLPVVGDWDGDGRDEPGVYRPGNGTFHLRAGVAPKSRRAATVTFGGKARDVPVAGDWNNDGYDTIGVVRGKRWLLTNDLDDPKVHRRVPILRNAGDIPVTGRWQRNRGDRPGVHRSKPFG